MAQRKTEKHLWYKKSKGLEVDVNGRVERRRVII